MNYISDQKALAIDRGWSGGVTLDTGVVMRIQYIGAQPSGTITVATDDMTFQHGALGAEAVDTGIGVSGVFDLTAAAYDTAGEVVDAINGSSGGNWRAFLEAALRDDSTNATIIDKSETQAKVAGGTPIYWDGSESDVYGMAITGHEFVNLSSKPGFDDGLYTDAGCLNLLAFASCTITDLTGNTYLKVYNASQADTSSTVETKWSSAAMVDATQVSIGSTAIPLGQGILRSDENKRLIVRVESASALGTAAGEFTVLGSCIDLRRGRVQ